MQELIYVNIHAVLKFGKPYTTIKGCVADNNTLIVTTLLISAAGMISKCKMIPSLALLLSLELERDCQNVSFQNSLDVLNSIDTPH